MSLKDERAWLTVKGERSGLTGPGIRVRRPASRRGSHPEVGLRRCLIRKTRHYAVYAGVTWGIDEYEGALSGTILVEVELEREDQALTLQPWICPEVTGDPRFRQSEPLRLSSQIP